MAETPLVGEMAALQALSLEAAYVASYGSYSAGVQR